MSTSSSPYPDALNNRVNFKLNAASMHLDNLKRLEDTSQGKSLASSDVRMQAEIEIDEFFYHLVGVKDALLHEINRDFKLGIKLREVKIDTVSAKLEQKKRPVVATIVTEHIRKMQFDKQKQRKKKKQHPLWLITEFNNHSKHREMIGKKIVVVNGDISNVSLIYPHTSRVMKKPMIDYLNESYKRIERLQKNVRNKIRKYNI